MEDSTAMTIDFLRARLLSERSVSRSARQRAEELAKRVAELEEQLKVVSMQRKMAEKATADVLAILEDNGVSEISEALDSNSDLDTPCESKAGDTSLGDDLCSVNSKARKRELDDLSGSDPDSSSVIANGLSWKGRTSSPRPLEKYKDYSVRRQRSITSVGSSSSSSPKLSLGRSCRQIKQRETRLIDDGLKTEPLEDHSEDYAVAISSEVSPHCLIDYSKTSRQVSDTQEEKVLLDTTFGSLSQNQANVKTKDLDFNEYRKENDMEKALENQAQLIDRYEAMEKAQRDWEEKFRENNSSTPDSCDHGNHSDVTDEREEIRAHPPTSSPIDLKEMETNVDDILIPKMQVDGNCISDNLPNVSPPHSSLDMGDPKTSSDGQPKTVPQLLYANIGNSKYNEEESTIQRFKDDVVSQSAADFTFPMHKTKESETIMENGIHLPEHSCEQKEFLGDQSFKAQVLDSKSNVSKVNNSAGRNDECNELVLSDPGLVGVIDALKQARLSLQKKMNSNSSVMEGDKFRHRGIESSLFAPKNGGSLDRLPSYAGLFRLPTDYLVESYTRTNFLRPGSQLKVPHSYPNGQNSASSSEQLAASPFSEPRSRLSSNDLIYPDDRNLIAWTESPQRPPLYRYSNDFAILSSPYVYPALPKTEEFSRTFLSRGAESPLGSEYSRYEDHNRHGMYR